MKCYGGFLSNTEYYKNSTLLTNNLHRPAQVLGFTDLFGGTYRYIGKPTRQQRLAEARDAFEHHNFNTPMYHVTLRKQNKKGETVGIELIKISKIKQIAFNLAAQIRIILGNKK